MCVSAVKMIFHLVIIMPVISINGLSVTWPDISSASSNSANGITDVTCSPASFLLIRTAFYLTTPSGPPAHKVRVTRSNIDQPMSRTDLLTVYRHCGLHPVGCDLSTTSLEPDFNITYMCMKEENVINPCYNTTTERAGNDVSFLLDYSDFFNALDVQCECLVTSSGGSIIDISSVNAYQNLPQSHGVSVDLFNEDWKWGVESRQATPIAWRLQDNNSTLLSVSLKNVAGTSFGFLWLRLQGSERDASATVHCRATWLPGEVTTLVRQRDTTGDQLFNVGNLREGLPTYKETTGHWALTLPVIVAMLPLALALVVLVGVAVSRLVVRRNENRGRDSDTSDREITVSSDLEEGATCPEKGQYIQITHDTDNNEYSDVQPRDHTRVKKEDWASSPRPSPPLSGEYQSLWLRLPAVTQGTRGGADSSIYDHPHSPVADKEAQYDFLQHHSKAPKVKVIDNEYDTLAAIKGREMMGNVLPNQ